MQKVLKFSRRLKKKIKKPLHFYNTCFYQTGILDKHTMLDICNSNKQLDKTFGAETRPTSFEQSPVNPKKNLLGKKLLKVSSPSETTL